MDSWPPRDSTIVKAALPALFTGLLSIGVWAWTLESRLVVLEAEGRQGRKELDSLQVKVQSSIESRNAMGQDIQQKLNDIKIMVVRIESAMDGESRRERRRR